MSTSFHLCQDSDLDKLVELVMRRRAEAGDPADEDHIRKAMTPLADQSADGAAYVFGPAKAPVGYLALTFRWSVAMAGREAQVEDLYIRPSVRRRGLATEALIAIGNAMRSAGVVALHAQLPDEGDRFEKLARDAGFVVSAGPNLARRIL